METKKAKVTSVKPTGSWDSKYGIMYQFDIEFDNGDKGQYQSKEQEQKKFKEGEIIEYELVLGGAQPKVKPVYKIKQQSYNVPLDNDADKDIRTRSMSMSYAKDLAVAKVINIKDLANYATKINNWITQKS